MSKRHPATLREFLATIVPAGVLTWALSMLTVSYLGYAKIDAAFISSLVTSVLAVYGISRKEDTNKIPPKTRQSSTIKRTPKPPLNNP